MRGSIRLRDVPPNIFAATKSSGCTRAHRRTGVDLPPALDFDPVSSDTFQWIAWISLIRTEMSAPTRNPKKPTDDPLLAVIEPALKVGAFAGKIDPGSPEKYHQE